VKEDLPKKEVVVRKTQWFWITSPQALWRTPAILLFAHVTGMVIADWVTVVSWGFNLVLVSATLTGFTAFGGLIGLLVSPFFLLSKARRRTASLTFLSSLACLIEFAGGARLGNQIRQRAFVELAERSRRLVNAIKNYKAQVGHPPQTLEELVPNFISKIPKTGLGAYPKYEYVAGEEAKRFADNPWALYVFTPSGGINFDQFLYFPRQNYPNRGYGGRPERIGDWAYVHE